MTTSHTLEIGSRCSLLRAIGWANWIIFSSWMLIFAHNLSDLLILDINVQSEVMTALAAFICAATWLNRDPVDMIGGYFPVCFYMLLGSLLGFLVWMILKSLAGNGKIDAETFQALFQLGITVSCCFICAFIILYMKYGFICFDNVSYGRLRSIAKRNRVSGRPFYSGKPQRLASGLALLLVCFAISCYNSYVVRGGLDQLDNVSRHLVESLNNSLFPLLLGARAFLQPSASTLLTKDRRRPILFLRSFKDEKQFTASSSSKNFLTPTLETLLASYFSRFGPFIAIADPRLKTRFAIGAARAQCADDEWQNVIYEWIENSILILVSIGNSPWIRWEIETIIRLNAAERVLLFFPPLKKRWFRRNAFHKEMTSRLAVIKEAFENTEWSRAVAEVHDAPSIRSIALLKGGKVCTVRAVSRGRSASLLSVIVAHACVLDWNDLIFG